MPISGNFTMFCSFIRRSPSWNTRHDASYSVSVKTFAAEVHFRGLLYLSEALQVKDENVGQGPQAELNAALLELLAVWTSPCVIRSQLGIHGDFRSMNRTLRPPTNFCLQY